MAVSRRALFEGILDALGEKITARATSVGTTTTFISTDGLYFADNELRGREVWYAESNHATSASNKWTRRFITGNSEANARITVTPAWPAEPQIGDVIILANARGYSVTIPEIHDKIDDLIQQAGEEMATESTSAEVTFNGLTGTVTYPTDWTYLLGAQWRDWNSEWIAIPPEDLDLFADTWGGKVTINNRSRRLAHQRTVRLIGATALSALANDDATTTVDYTWLRYQAAAELRRDTAIRWGDVATALTLSQILQAEADKARPRVGKRFSPVGRRWRINS